GVVLFEGDGLGQVGDGPFVVALLLVDQAAEPIVPGAAPPLQGLGVIGQGTVELPAAAQQVGPIGVGGRIVRGDAHKRIPVNQGAIAVALALVGVGANAERGGVVGLEGEGAAEVGDGLVVIALVAPSQAAVVGIDGLIGVEAHGGGEGVDGLVEPALS